MKKMLFVLVALLIVAPAMAEDVEITAVAAASADGNDAVVTISIDASASTVGIVRAIALDITVIGEANIVDVNCVNEDYTIYPGSINIAGSGEVSDDGSCLCDDEYAGTLAGLDTNGVTIEMGSLFVGAGNAPGDVAALVEVTVAGCDPVDLEIALNEIRGGIVMEDPDDEPTVLLTGDTIDDLNSCYIPECMKLTAPEYATWDTWGKPDCWCYAKQCRGDINGALFIGKPVTLADLNVFKLAFNQLDVPLAGVANGICADLNHAAFIGKRVTLADLNTIKLYFNQLDGSVPECDDTNYNFWLP